MYFEIERKELLASLKTITGVVEQKQTLQILANALISVKNNTLNLMATNLETAVACCLPLNPKNLDANNEGEITIPARKFFDICKSLPDSATIQVNIKENHAIVKAGKSKFKLQTLPAADFPTSPQMAKSTEFYISQQHLKKLLNKTIFCVAIDDARYYLNGLLLEICDGKLSLVGTDGHRMAVSQLDYESEQTLRVIVPRKAVIELSKLLTDSDNDIKISADDNHIRFELNDDYVMSSKLIGGDFPEWNGVIPSNPEKIVLAEAEPLKQSLRRASIISNDKHKGLKLALANNLLTINAKNAYQEEAEEIVEIEYSGEELEIGFNGVYILDAINAVATKTIQLAFSDSNGSVLITEEDNEDSRFIVMPVRL